MCARGAELDTTTGAAIPASQTVSFAGLIASTDCPGGTITTVSRAEPDDGDHYDVELTGSSIEDERGNPIACSTLEPGDAVQIDGAVNDDGTFGRATIVVTSP